LIGLAARALAARPPGFAARSLEKSPGARLVAAILAEAPRAFGLELLSILETADLRRQAMRARGHAIGGGAVPSRRLTVSQRAGNRVTIHPRDDGQRGGSLAEQARCTAD